MATDHSFPAERPTSVRHLIVGWATIMSVLLYLDRFCISICTNYIRQDLNVDPAIVGRLSTAFFFTYALCQVPSGWLTDRFGVRLMLTIFILGWSACTGLQAFVQSFALLAILQLCCGMMQAGAYPAGARLVRDWNPPFSRGRGSAMVALGGRIGGAMAPILTAQMMVLFVPTTTDSHVTSRTALNPLNIARKWVPATESSSPATLAARQFAHLWQLLSPAEQTLISDLRLMADQNAAARQSDPGAPQKAPRPEQEAQLRETFNRLIESPALYDPELFDLTIEAEGQSLSRLRSRLESAGKSLPAEKLQRLNRLALESTFGKDFGNVYMFGWRPSMLVYGVVGLAIAALFWWQVRDNPSSDPRCNAAERLLILDGIPSQPAAKTAAGSALPVMAMLTSISLWGNCLVQITTNIGWVFLVRTMPQYLDEVHHVPLVMRGVMTSVPIWVGVIGVFCGGRLTDWLGRRFGLTWGRRLPVLITRVTAALGYVICIALSFLVPPEQAPLWMPWVYVAALSLVAISVDLGVPSIWAFMQDIGGRHTASVLGWGNMWGNLGAAAATEIYGRILGSSATLTDWNNLFACLAGVFLLGIVGTLLMDASKPLVQEQAR